MAYCSNVSIKSNIYVNRSKSQFDRDFIRHIEDYQTLADLKQEYLDKNDGILTPAQRDLLEQGNPRCSFDWVGDKSWGFIIEDEVPILVCKCEKTDCKNWPECSSQYNFRKIERTSEDTATPEERYTTPDFGLLRHLDEKDREIYLKTFEKQGEEHKPLEIKFENTKTEETGGIKKTKESEDAERSQETEDDTKANPPQRTVQKPIDIGVKVDAPIPVKYKKIDSPDEIIKTKINERLIINAGPGTGKTYSVIKRLEYIINNELADPKKVLVLCYSRSAVGVIKKRINDEIKDGLMPVEAKQLFDGIRTFDSFVTYLLSDGELEGVINNLDYDERIEKFISEFNKDSSALEELEYLIIDEMQDLVGVRARMVKTLLERIKCGFLLLGDVCQSIYDYLIQDENELNSTRFYKWMDSKFNNGVKRFELTKNMRQTKELAKYEKDMREAIILEDVKRQEESLATCVNELKQDYYLGNIKKIDHIDSDKFQAILCRNNAEVSIISTEFWERDIVHRISKRAQHIDLAPWIADILSTYTEKRIGFTAFKQRTIHASYKDAEDKWKLLKAVAADDSENVLNVELLVKLLVAGKDLPAELDSSGKDAITVSTIHRAKGREYNGVILLSNDYDRNDNKQDEIKVTYVAFTRGKECIAFCDMPKYYIKQLDSKRWIGTGMSKSHKPFCKNFEVGLDGDIDPYSFVSKNIEDARARQEHIANLKPGDVLDIWFIEGEYRIYHDGFFIGRLSDKIYYELRDAMNKTNHSPTLPNHFSKVYVNNVITIANTKFNDEIAEPYNKSGLWLGVEISGFAKADWS